MRKAREILRLRMGKGLSERQTSRCCGVSRNTVRDYVKRAEEAGLSWPVAADVDLQVVLFKSAEKAVSFFRI